MGPGRTRPRGVGLDAHDVVGQRCCSVTVVTSRISRPVVDNPDVVSIGSLSGCGHGAGGSGVVIGDAGGRDGVADRGAGRRRPVAGRGADAGLYQPAGVRLVDDDPGSTISAPTVSATEVAVQGARWRGSHLDDHGGRLRALVVVSGQRFLGSRAVRLWGCWESLAVGVGGRVGPRGGMVALAAPLGCRAGPSRGDGGDWLVVHSAPTAEASRPGCFDGLAAMAGRYGKTYSHRYGCAYMLFYGWTYSQHGGCAYMCSRID